MNRLLVICGPTATGKTALALSLAQIFNGEIVNADSRQVYRGMDIGTGKDIPVISKFKEAVSFPRKRESSSHSALDCRVKPENGIFIGYRKKKEVPVWLVDVVDPDYPFNVSEYVRCAQQVIADIQSRGILPIVVGGTGFYIKALLDPPATLHIPADITLRKHLDGMSVTELQEKMFRLDTDRFRRMNVSDRNNPRRLVRGIEVAASHSSLIHNQHSHNPQISDVYLIGLTAPLSDLYQRIDARVEKRYRTGVVDEIGSLLKMGYSWHLPSFSGCGYRVWQLFFENSATLQETVERWKFQEHAYARRQLTWFRKQKDTRWFEISGERYEERVQETVREWYTGKHGNES